ncbi:aspartate carbamoyltransferase [Ruminococcus flavefaciens]|uniref:Aspartate carbamoyltransferase n=1 Tax=Ruminococcus flavefaciens TaxID=1265 RepID=A0A315Y5F2_RUMFL|nr:aspartate carbamoyltransferase [Ruminococcus flavefaciens]PWJ15193.1 aspartate carbamoyltransferase [Ruminococcus flavefaciens]SSA40239.1 aspartate carbamoyltransferase [Ruminococcus flavefaciens]
MFSKYQHLIDLNDYPVSWWKNVVELGEKIYRSPADYAHVCDGKIMATLFYEPSTRTQMSFQTAMIRLGGQIIGFDNPANSSVSKGETIKDTTKIVSNYADVLVIRHPVAGAAKAASLTSDCSVINAGDGGHLHPTQTLTDLLTLKIEKQTLSGLTIGMCGDLLNGRTVHSLCKALSMFENNKFVFISTSQLGMPAYIKDIIKANGSSFTEVNTLEEAIGSLDVLYMTRIQQERFASEEEYLAQKNTYVLDKKKMLLAAKDMIVMHPLPRVDEITVEVDDDERAMYFKQAKYGMYVRMALIMTILKEKKPSETLKGKVFTGVRCSNPRCITNHEEYLPKSFRSSGDETLLECEYCDERKLI